MKFRLKVVKLSNFETPSPIFPAPLSPISLFLINLKIQHDFSFLLKAILLILEEIKL
jgi:hypothetical protein